MGFENLSGRVFGQYELREMLGVGGMGAVYRAYHSSLDREVAVKVLPRVLAMESGYIERFIREARTAGLLEHPHIVRIYDYGTQGEISYLVMALLRGGSLSQRLSQRESNKHPHASLGEVAVMLNQIASALDYAHHEGVLHRDIKPANIMFDNQGRAYLTDFGIAKLMGATTALTGTGVAMGSPSYMPPEQWAGQDLTPAADQYALGVTIYQTIAGRLPFEADSAAQLMYKHFHEEPTPISLSRTDIPASVMIVLNRALGKSPDQRFPNITQFAQAFESAIEGKQGDMTNFFLHKVKSERPLSTSAGTPYPGDPPPSAPVPVSPTSGGMPPTPTAPTPSGIAPSGAYPTTYVQQVARPWYLSPVVMLGVAGIIIVSIFAIVFDGASNDETDVQETLAAVSAAQTEISTQLTAVAQAIIATSTNTPEPTATNTPEITQTIAETPSEEPTQLIVIIASDTAEPSATVAATETPTETPTNTDVATEAPTNTATATATPTETETATVTQEPTATNTTPFTATYTFTPRPTATATDSPTWTPQPQIDGGLVIGEATSGEIANSAPEAHYEFLGTAGQTISLLVERTSGNLDPSLVLYGPDNSIIAENDDISLVERNAAIVDFTLPADGIYKVAVQRFRGARGTSEGSFTLTFSATEAPEPEHLAYNSPVQGFFNNEIPSREFAIEVKTGMTISVAIYAVSGDLDTILTLYTPTGEVAATNDDYAGLTNSSVIDRYIATADGIYRLEVSRFRAAGGSTSGAYILTLTEGEPAAQPEANDTPTLYNGDTASGVIDAERYESLFVYQGIAGDTLTVTLAALNGTLDPLLRVLNPDGTVLAENDDTPNLNNSSSLISVTLPQTGPYTIVATRFRGPNGTTTGDFELKVLSGEVQTPVTCSEIGIGCTAYISSSIIRSVNLRTEPRANADILAALDAGTSLTIIAGPHTADAFTWWQVALADGTQGWLVARIGFNDVLVTALP